MLKLLPKALAKCAAPEPRAYPPTEGVCLREAPVRGRWLVEKTILGRTKAIELTRDQLAQVVLEGAVILRSEEGQ